MVHRGRIDWAGTPRRGMCRAALVFVALALAAPSAGVLPASASVSFSGEYFSPRSATRPVRKSTRFIILHTTEGSARGALEKLQRNGECHYVVDTNGRVYRIIDRRRIAFHAGRSMWGGVTDLDSCSIGIEMVGYHDKDLTAAQYTALRTLLADLKTIYKVSDDRVLTHSMVAYGTPNRWQSRSHRGRKRCGMLLADPARRRRLGLYSKPAFDPDVRAGRLVDADPELTRILYRGPSRSTPPPAAPSSATPSATPPRPAPAAAIGSASNVIGPGRSAWDIARDLYNAETTLYTFPDGSTRTGRQITNWKAMQAGTRVTVGHTGVENPSDRVLTLGKDGNTPWELAGEEASAASTFYFIPGQQHQSGRTITGEQLKDLPQGTRMLVGYSVGGPIAAGRPAFAVCGVRWNRPDTYYLTPRYDLISGDKVNERNIPSGSMVFYRK